MILIHLFEEEYQEYIALNNLADLYLLQQRWKDAEPLYVKALSLAYFLHENSTRYITSGQLTNIINKLADLYSMHNFHAKAESLYLEVVKLNRRRYQGHSYEYWWSYEQNFVEDVLRASLNKLKNIYLSQGRLIEARYLHIEALKIEISDMTYLDLIHNLSKSISLHYSQSQLRDATHIRDISLKICSYLYNDLSSTDLVVDFDKSSNQYSRSNLNNIVTGFASFGEICSLKDRVIAVERSLRTSGFRGTAQDSYPFCPNRSGDCYNNIVSEQKSHERQHTSSNIFESLNILSFRQSGMNAARLNSFSIWIFIKIFKAQIVNLKCELVQEFTLFFSLSIFMKYLKILDDKIPMEKSCGIYGIDTT
jgi:tetratricopeptide (TPR) repeat protein